MRKLIFLLFMAICVIVIISCNDQVEPKAAFDEVYTLNCVIRCDTSYQVATITRSYDVNGYNPNTNMDDPFFEGAKITLTYNSPYGVEVYQFRDTSVVRSDTSRYKTPLHYYYLKNFQPIYKNRLIRLEAILPNGKKLVSASGTIVISSYDINYFKQVNPRSISPEILSFGWGNLYSGQIYSLPEFHIKYKKNENGTWKDYVKLIPLFYSKGKNAGIPIYPYVTSSTGVSYDTTTIRKTFEEISAGDPNKQNYWIDKIIFMAHIMDVNLATTISAQQTFNSEFSVRVTQPDFTNIGNGLGVFGIMYTVKLEVQMPWLIRSLGYRAN